jgi:hypothetical protein
MMMMMMMIPILTPLPTGRLTPHTVDVLLAHTLRTALFWLKTLPVCSLYPRLTNPHGAGGAGMPEGRRGRCCAQHTLTSGVEGVCPHC